MISITSSANSNPNTPQIILIGDTEFASRTELSDIAAKNKLGNFYFLPGTPMQLAVATGSEPLDLERIRYLGGSVARHCSHLPEIELNSDLNPEQILAFAEGFVLGGFKPGQLKSNLKEQTSNLHLVSKQDPAEIQNMVKLANIVNSTRELINLPGNHLYPENFATSAADLFKNHPNIEVQVWDQHELEKQRCGGILAVGKGSARPPRLVKITLKGSGAKIALVGKGITFDTGGLSLKPAESMVGMKYDMSGAATVLAVMQSLSQQETDSEVTAYLCLAENMPSGEATRPGDVITMRNGKTVEVLNTDAEGRLVLADGLVLASEDNPDLIIDVATLTGAATIALGTRYVGAMGEADAVAKILQATEISGEKVWPMPLPEELRELLDSDTADIANVKIGNRAGGMLIAGHFLQEFVGKNAQGQQIPWVHLDIASAANNSSGAYGYTPKGATGVMIRTLLEVVKNLK